MAGNTQYITIENDRWDLICLKAYGDYNKKQLKVLQNANPFIPITMVFKPGVKIVVPIIVDETTISIDDLLPPWKRKTNL